MNANTGSSACVCICIYRHRQRDSYTLYNPSTCVHGPWNITKLKSKTEENLEQAMNTSLRGYKSKKIIKKFIKYRDFLNVYKFRRLKSVATYFVSNLRTMNYQTLLSRNSSRSKVANYLDHGPIYIRV